MKLECPVLISQTYQRVSQGTDELMFLPGAVSSELQVSKTLTSMGLEFVGVRGIV